MYTTGETTRLLNISRPTLYKLCKVKGIKPKKTVGGNYRFSDNDIRRLINKTIDENDIEEKFVNAVNDVWMIFKGFAEEIWGLEKGETRLKEILRNNKEDIFIINISNFK